MNIIYAVGKTVTVEEFRAVLQSSTLGQRRPVNDKERLNRMLANANLIVTARDNGKLIGISRSITDFSYCCYLSDLAVDQAYQRQGIGKELIRQTHLAAGNETNLILVSAPAAVEYYPHVGFEKIESAWLLPRQQ